MVSVMTSHDGGDGSDDNDEDMKAVMFTDDDSN